VTDNGQDQLRIVLAILEQPDGRIVLQLRSDVEGIANPNKWGLFGGHVEPGESPAAAMLREIDEELSLQLRAEKLKLLTEWSNPENSGQYFFYHYPLGNEIDRAELREGERFAAFFPGQLYLGVIEGHQIVDHHLDHLKAFWETE
jgi:8-oxo-dGTP pyrophosphatase MutT (NUDIX family)